MSPECLMTRFAAAIGATSRRLRRDCGRPEQGPDLWSGFSILMRTIAFSVGFLFILRWNLPAYGRTPNIEIIGWQINRVAHAQKRGRFWVHYPSGF
jgi:hypothetical protein